MLWRVDKDEVIHLCPRRFEMLRRRMGGDEGMAMSLLKAVFEILLHGLNLILSISATRLQEQAKLHGS